MSTVVELKNQWFAVCEQSALVHDAGVCALVNDEQVAIFHLEKSDEKVFAVSNFCPIGKANVISRGILGSVANEPVVASPLYKQQFSLKNGRCFQEEAELKTYPVRI